ncbi:MAG TPA: metalloregulator ArsR/SmtB family transcription factor [Gemmatimonadaceae bacterium]|nr:metalloregulator ArsR/SmtB family transcription factor [Gemmatimonadaceae bacterium]
MIQARPFFDRLSALADPTRSRLLLLLDRHELTVGELCSALQLPQSTVSRHLKTLADEGWVTARAEGTSRRYTMPGSALDGGARRLWHLVREQVGTTPSARHDLSRAEQVLLERRSTSQAFFSSRAGQWDKVRAELYGARAELTPFAALLDPSWIVADLGCGTGQTAAALSPFVDRVIAVDESSAMLSAARRRLADRDNVDVRGGRLEALPVGDAELDAAILSLVLHFVVDPAVVLAEAARTMKPGARLLIVDMVRHEREEYRATMGHLWLGFDAEPLSAWLERAGFSDVRIVPLAPDPQAKGPGLFTARALRRSGGPAA